MLNLTVCSQGVREAIKNGDIAAVKKLLNEVSFFLSNETLSFVFFFEGKQYSWILIMCRV